MSFCLFVLFAILDYMSIVEMNKKEKLSPHFTLGEMTKTEYSESGGHRESEEVMWMAGDASRRVE